MVDGENTILDLIARLPSPYASSSSSSSSSSLLSNFGVFGNHPHAALSLPIPGNVDNEMPDAVVSEEVESQGSTAQAPKDSLEDGLPLSPGITGSLQNQGESRGPMSPGFSDSYYAMFSSPKPAQNVDDDSEYRLD